MNYCFLHNEPALSKGTPTDLLSKVVGRNAEIGVIGLGYVGLPLISEFCKAGFNVTGFDIDPEKVDILKNGGSYINHIDSSVIKQCLPLFNPTDDFSRISAMDCIIICVPTPLNNYREPDMSYVFDTTRTIATYLRRDQLIVLESTTYPGTTDDLRSILEETGLKAGKDFHLAFSPEREDPNNKDYATSKIPKVVGGHTPECLEIVKALYDQIVDITVPVSTTRVAEATKLLENIYRAVNIALVNELKLLFDRMDIDVWEVIEAAKTKPFGFQAFYPGPGLGGHCIPIDPFYLTWKARQYDFSTRFIQLAGEINTQMPYVVTERIASIINNMGKPTIESKVLILGVAYKKNVDDQRESPALKVISLLMSKGVRVDYHDIYVPLCRGHRHYPGIDMESTELTAESLRCADVVVLMTDHACFDYTFIEKHAQCIVDTRNAFAYHGIRSPKIQKV